MPVSVTKLRIADAISAEVTHLSNWYVPWRDSVAVGYRDWQNRLARGECPPLFYFRVPGSEQLPVVGWQTGVTSGLLEVFDADLVFEIGNTYHEWSDIGDRLARYHASTETLVFPELSTGEPLAYDAAGRLKPPSAANLRLMEEILAEYDDKFARAVQMQMKVNSAVAVLRGR